MDFNVSAPPVNNALLPDIYNRLDAETIEKTRVVNTLLDKRFSMQEKVLNKYRRSAQVVHDKEVLKIRKELSRIRHSLPTVGHVHNLNAGLLTSRKKRVKRRGIPEDKDESPFCERHFIHFLPNKRKFYKVQTPESDSDKSVKTLPAICAPSNVTQEDNSPSNVRISDQNGATNSNSHTHPSKLKGSNYAKLSVDATEKQEDIFPEINGLRINRVSRTHVKSDSRLRNHSSPPKL